MTSNAMQSKKEVEYLEKVKNYPEYIFQSQIDSKEEGFEYLFSKSGITSKIRFIPKLGTEFGRRGTFRVLRIFMKYQRRMIKGINKSYVDLAPYMVDLERKKLGLEGLLPKSAYSNTYPNKDLLSELQENITTTYDFKSFGFTELPEKLIFKGKAVLYKYALVFIQEMKKEKIEMAPQLDAGEEVQRVYSSLGNNINSIASWLREKGIKCQSVHPLGGLVDLTPLAGKAGLGGLGMNGLLITKEYGQRLRIATIFLEEKLFEFTDSNEHVWIEEYCKLCHACYKACPVDAINEEKVVSILEVEGIGNTLTCIDREKCFDYFLKTLGCAVCMSVCPFSKKPENYDQYKNIIEKRKLKSGFNNEIIISN
jgi:ferredoxin